MYRVVSDTDKKERLTNPKTKANILEILTFSWMFNLFKIGHKRELDENDLYTTLKDHESSSLGDKLEKTWKLELANSSRANRKPSLLRALIRMFGTSFMTYGILLSVDDMFFKITQPLFIGGLLSYFNHDDSNQTNLENAYIYASCLVICMVSSLTLFHSSMVEVLHCAMKTRIACSSIIYRKALRLSHTALGKTTTGQVINMLSNDVNRFDMSFPFLHFLWIGPLQTIVVTYFLWQEIGISSLFGIVTLIFVIPLQGWMGKKISEIRSKTTKRTDERIQLMDEIISGIQVIKMYTWEKPFARLVEYARKKEIKYIKGSSYIRAILMSFVVVQTRFQLFISILSYVLLGNDISLRKVFVVASFYQLLLPTMTHMFSQATGQIGELMVSIKRIENFLLLEEKDDRNASISKSEELNSSDTNNSTSIILSKATAKWTKDQTVNSLENINLTVRPNQLVAIIGQVGAGKSSLIQVILQELPLTDGSISINGIVSFASQEPWLFASTIQQNILFDAPMDKTRYKQVVKACALANDFEQLPQGDQTIVGERGTTLSGGQRARINLARAVYKQADIYLLDDPLSAVDTRVGKHIFENCIKGYLKGKTCILITHQIQYLTDVDHIVLLDNAHILAEGSFHDLQRSGKADFIQLIESVEDETIKSDIQHNNLKNSYKTTNVSTSNIKESNLLTTDESKICENHIEPIKEDETNSSKQISKNVYLSYLSASGNIYKVSFFFFTIILTQALATGGDYWISYWVSHEEYYIFCQKNNVSTENVTSVFSDWSSTLLLPADIHQNSIIIYSILIIASILAVLIRAATFVSVCITASINLHKKLFNSIIRATMSFFNTNSSGPTLNCFSKDIGDIDEDLPIIFFTCFQIAVSLLGIIFVVGLINYYLMIPTFIVGIIFYKLRNLYLPTSRSVKQLEAVARSPVYAHMNASVQGLTTIRAYEAEQTLIKEFDYFQDLHSSAWYLFIFSNEAFGLWLNFVCIFYISTIMFSFLVYSNNTNGGNFGLAITQTLGMIGMVQWGIRQSAVLENQITSVERVLEYSKSPQEASLETLPDKIPPKEWPSKGQIIFQNLNLRYSLNASPVLKNLNIMIQPTEKIGIIGRTGAGKSSIIGALFRLAFNEGNIIVDGIEIHELGLHDLRSKISIIPQEPVLFTGSIRTNLDPFEEYPDHILWNALDEVELKSKIENLPGGLNSKISESGSNFSVGQKQLICLARAIIRNNKILVLDEATANVDLQTDALIQNTIRSKFRTCTVLTIAHRLKTVMDSDKILVMDAGRVVEFDHPNSLMNNKDGYLYNMVENKND